MQKFCCGSGCKNCSEEAGTCTTEGCANHGKPLTSCECKDGSCRCETGEKIIEQPAG